ncbi:MAG: DUF5053 domain-containing protein [Porphyromonas sp.]|nr:DUF5053 domain-containing protein [Porphyromonas sp.]
MEKKPRPKDTLSDILDVVSWLHVANDYFSKSVSWFYQRMDERDVNGYGKPARFTDEQREELRGALYDIAERIRQAADKL